jgi:hypothetical protein
MEIIKLNIEEIKPYKNNAKIHTAEQIEQIKNSIKEFGFNDPIAIWGKENLVVEGHGRLLAVKELGYKEVDCIRLDHLTDEERRAYTLAHNKLTMNTDFHGDLLSDELSEILNINMEDFGFGKIEDMVDEDNEKPEIEFTEVLGEEHNYIVLYFDNEVDWLQLESLIDVKEKNNLSTRKDGKITENMARKSIGRVFKAKKF